MGPFFDFRPLHKRQDENDFLFGQFETSDIIIERQVFLYLVHKCVGLTPVSMEGRGVFAHCFNVRGCGDWLVCSPSCCCRSPSSWWSSSTWWSRRSSSGSSPSFSHGNIQEFVEFCFGEGVLWSDGGGRRRLCRRLGGSHGSAGDALREVTLGDTEEWSLGVWCRWCEGVFDVYWTVPDSGV